MVRLQLNCLLQVPDCPSTGAEHPLGHDGDVDDTDEVEDHPEGG